MQTLNANGGPAAGKLNTAWCQTGLAWFPEHAIYASFHVKEQSAALHEPWQALARDLESLCETRHLDQLVLKGGRTVVLKGIGFQLWNIWAPQHELPRLKDEDSMATLKKHASAFACTRGDLWFHIKSDLAADAAAVLNLIEARLKDSIQPVKPNRAPVVARKRYHGKVLGGRFTDGLENPADEEDLSARILIGDGPHRGGAFLISQRFKHDWDKIEAMTEQAKQDMIGRDGQDRILATDDESSHIKRSRHIESGERMNSRLLRQALPYGQAAGNPAHEEGVMFAGYAQSTAVLDSILDSIAGTKKGFIQDALFGVTHGVEGSYWYLPSRKECGLDGPAPAGEVTMNEYFNVRSANGWMFYNARDYQHKIRDSKLAKDWPLSERILELLNKQFSRWQDSWYKPRQTPPLPSLAQCAQGDELEVLTKSVMLRKGMATKLSLARELVKPKYAEPANLMRIDPDEIIVGNMPQLSLGIGTQVMEYLSDDERLTGFFSSLNEYSATGHNVPDYPLLLAKGIDGLIDTYRNCQHQHDIGNAQQEFYQAAIWSLEGLSGFIEAYAALADGMKAEAGRATVRSKNLDAIAQRMRHLAHRPPAGFVDGLQLVFITNCALHQIGEPHSIGRLDQQLNALYEADLKGGAITPDSAQEAIDAFWLKMDETVLYNYKHLNDYLTYGTGAVFYGAGNFPQGAAINQWVQQVTVGGVKAVDGKEPQDASNDITLMCLRAARRLPLNAPCLSLRVHGKMKPELFEEAAKTLLSGGAHPVLLNDDKMVPALFGCGGLSLADARDYVCDGCYEPVIQGKTEWAFSYVPLPPIVDYTLNEGCDIQGAGPIHLKGMKKSWNSPPASEIKSFEQFLEFFDKHWKWAISGFFRALMLNYGNLAGVCPSPLFSALLTDSAKTGRDMTDGGARYHIVAPMMCGIADAIDSLFAIKRLVFDPETARCTLPQLLRCLQCDWGKDMKAPFYAGSEGVTRLAGDAELFTQLRQVALALPKFGVDADPDVKALARDVISRCVKTIHETLNSPLEAIAKPYQALKDKYGTRDRPFAFVVTPGVGTFEDNVGLGMGMGASANGRRSGQPIGADFTASPLPPDLPFVVRQADAFTALKDWAIDPITLGIANAAPSDLNIREDFPQDQLAELIAAFAKGELGSNMITITCADPATYDAAAAAPEKYDLLRVRTGGWSEYFVAMFDFHQEYFRRRVYYGPRGTPRLGASA